jgi:hypothetical protein
MMLESAQGMVQGDVCPVFPADEGAEIVAQSFFPPPAVGLGEDGGGIAQRLEIPKGQVEEMNGFFQNPGTDPLPVPSPPGIPKAVGPPPEIDEEIERIP